MEFESTYFFIYDHRVIDVQLEDQVIYLLTRYSADPLRVHCTETVQDDDYVRQVVLIPRRQAGA